MVVHQPADAAQRVATVEYQPSVITSEQAATVLDVNVLPEGKIDTTGNAIQKLHVTNDTGKADLHNTRTCDRQSLVAARVRSEWCYQPRRR